LRLPRSAREKAFVAAIRTTLRQDGPAPWPILVFAAPDRRKHGLDVSSVATTRRILLRDEKAVFRPAIAIVLNSSYWGGLDPSPSWTDSGMIVLSARHELYHAQRAWLHAQQTAAHADAIAERVRLAGAIPVERKGLELLVSAAMAAEEEMAAIDRSLRGAAIGSDHRRGILEYREANRLRDAAIVKSLLGLFTPAKDLNVARELNRWLAHLLHE
jgi:hypothetical protein